jgi:alpha-amylase
MSLNFIFCVHNHQPVGNFEDVMESAYRQAYEPFLDLIDKFTQIKLCMHYSGPLLEYLTRSHPKLISRIQKMVDDNRLEIVGGGFYEPILTMLPDADKIGQIVLFSDYLERLFGRRPRGIWLAERVWEQSLVKPLAQAGVEYTIIDDFHFKTIGFLGKELSGYFISEEQGKTISLFPIPERLRYAIPFKEPIETINYLSHCCQTNHKNSNVVVCYADDGEKFGLWPKTYEHCYQNGWLERFFQTLNNTQDWLKITTFSEVIDKLKPMGKTYIPSGSYREMAEWVLSTEATMVYEGYKQHQPVSSEFTLNPGGFWRNFLVKYPEINIMYSKMMQVSHTISSLSTGQLCKKDKQKLADAQRELYRGQGNCAYWHGVFGGFYLPHLRHAIYHHLINAEEIVSAMGTPQNKSKSRIDMADFDYDGYSELRFSNKAINCYFKPSQGATLYEMDIIPKKFNPLATIRRRQESYHQKILQAQGQNSVTNVTTIHDIVLSKVKGLENLLYYDNYPRQSLLDHFLNKNTVLKNFACCHYDEEGDFLREEYKVYVHPDNTSVQFHRDGSLKQSELIYPIRVVKNISFDSTNNQTLLIDYEIINTSSDYFETIFAPEFNLSMLAGNAPDRFYYNSKNDSLGPLITEGESNNEKMFGIKDLFQKIDIYFRLTKPAQIWYFPVQTVSQSESGFELVYQSSVILPRWKIKLSPKEKWTVRISKIIKLL